MIGVLLTISSITSVITIGKIISSKISLPVSFLIAIDARSPIVRPLKIFTKYSLFSSADISLSKIVETNS